MDLSDFTRVAEWIRRREFRLRARGGPGAGKGPDAMVYGVSAPESAPPSPPGLAATEAQGSPVDPVGGCSSRPLGSRGATRQQQPQTQSQQQQQPEDPWALDALGKGKGKGKGKGLDCWKCLGDGHPSFLCPSGKGAGKAGSGPTCGNCRD